MVYKNKYLAQEFISMAVQAQHPTPARIEEFRATKHKSAGSYFIGSDLRFRYSLY